MSRNHRRAAVHGKTRMRSFLVLASLGALASTASADRSTVMSVGLTGDARANGASYSDAGGSPVSGLLAGARLSLTFEDAPVAIPPPGLIDHDARIVPELFAGFLANDVHAEGYVGAGARLEAQLASNMRRANLRTGIYVAGRGVIIGKHQDGALELALGEYLEHGAGRTRFGWEAAVMMRPRNDAAADRDHELDALVSIYLGWR
jgi:hypothetical protein